MKIKKLYLKIALVLLAVFTTTLPLYAWYYFIASNGERKQWVFGGSCNSAAGPINIVVDKNTSASYEARITNIINEWNTPFDIKPLPAGIGLLNPTYESGVTTMDWPAVRNFYNSRVENTIWIVYDVTGEVLEAHGFTVNSGLLGIGLALPLNSARPQDICSGIVIINAANMTGPTPEDLYESTTLHEIGHVLGLAHSVAGGNGATVNVVTITNDYIQSGSPEKLPVMFPFATLGVNPLVLHPDDEAAIYSVYGN